MGIYDQLVQLEKGTPPDSSKPIEGTSLNPEPDQKKPVPVTQTASHSKKSPKARLPESQIARNQASQKARLPESQKTRNRASQKSGKETNLPQSPVASQPTCLPQSQPEPWFEVIQPYLDLRAANKVSLRYPDTLIAWLEEALYQLKKSSHQKLTKNAILVAALAYVLWDLEQYGQASFLYRLFSQEANEEEGAA
ncbi:MAG: hypothetical protein H6658_11440 [Ardenticatenaceae bacterium]|nr:hypothetical protein [Ardenticatenaceae bacterium]